MIKPLKREALSKQIFDDLVQRIRRRELCSGDPIVVRTLQAEYGVSSTPVRDAISLLNRYGFLDVSSEQRTTIIHMDRKKVFDWLDYMAETNRIIVRYCFSYDVENAARVICAYARAFLACDPGDVRASLEAYLAMTNSFVDNCGNQAIARAVDPMLGGYAVAFGNYEDVFSMDACRQDAQDVIRGFETRDQALIQAVMTRLENAFRAYAQKAFPPEPAGESI